MNAVLEVGFAFWGLFAVVGAIIVGYAVWMVRADRSDPGGGGER